MNHHLSHFNQSDQQSGASQELAEGGQDKSEKMKKKTSESYSAFLFYFFFSKYTPPACYNWCPKH